MTRARRAIDCTRVGTSGSYITRLLDPKSEKATEEYGLASRIAELLFNVALCLRSPRIDAVFEIFKLRVDEFRLLEARANEWRGESRLEAFICRESRLTSLRRVIKSRAIWIFFISWRGA